MAKPMNLSSTVVNLFVKNIDKRVLDRYNETEEDLRHNYNKLNMQFGETKNKAQNYKSLEQLKYHLKIPKQQF